MKNLPLPRIKLAGTYLLIIMIMSVIFSLILYQISNEELKRQRDLPIPRNIPRSLVDEFDELREDRLKEARTSVQKQLVTFNLITLAGGAVLSYLLAKRALQPVERAFTAQQRFTSDASHEIRTPLTAMRSEIEVILRDKSLTVTDAKETLNSTLEEVAKLEALTGSLLELATAENAQLTLKSASLPRILRSSIKQLEPKAKAKNVEATLESPKSARAAVHEDSFRQAVIILLDNAVKYSPNKGTVTVKLKSSRSGGAKITIQDNGPGIPKEALPHVFERFYRADTARTESSSTGYGLGLSIAMQIIDNHGGTITLSSKEGKGTTATITLPK